MRNTVGLSIRAICIGCYLFGLLANFDAVSGILIVAGTIPICLYLVGDSLKTLLEQRFAFCITSVEGEKAMSIFLSLSCLLGIGTALSLGCVLSGPNLMTLLIAIMLLSEFAKAWTGNTGRYDRLCTSSIDIRSYLLVLLFGVFIATVSRIQFVWPSMPGWDIYTYLGGANWIVNNHGIQHVIVTTEGALPTSYLFQILVASIAVITHATPYIIVWIGPFVLVPFYGIAVMWTTFSFWKEQKKAFIAALVSMTISGGEHYLGPHYLLPSTISVIFFLLMVSIMLNVRTDRKLVCILLLPLLLLLYGFYYFPVVITLPVIVYLINKIVSKPYADNKWLARISTMSIPIMLSGSLVGGIMISPETLSLVTKISMLETTYPGVVAFLFLFGCLVTVIQYLRSKGTDKDNLWLLGYTLSMIIVYLIPLQSVERTELFMRSFLCMFASVGFVWIIERYLVPVGSGTNDERLSIRRRINQRVFVAAIVCSFLILSLGPYVSYGSEVVHWSNISRDEFDLAEWIKANAKENAYILTDPSTGYVLRGLTLRNASTSFIIDGHTPSPTDRRWGNLSDIIYAFFNEEDPLTARNYIDVLPTTPEFIVITTRTSDWLNFGVNSTICAPGQTSSFTGQNKFSTPFFNLIRRWETVQIYKIGSARIEPVWSSYGLADNWSWYLDGAWMYHSSETINGSPKISVQAISENDAWVGETINVASLSDATLIRVRYRIDQPCRGLKLILWNGMGEYEMIQYLPQFQEWFDSRLTMRGTKNISRIGLKMWTMDALPHTLEVNYSSLDRIVIT